MVNLCILTAGQDDCLEVKKTFDEDSYQFELKNEEQLGFSYFESTKDNYLLFLVYSNNVISEEVSKTIINYFQEKRDIELDMQFITVSASKQATTPKKSFYEYKSGLMLAPLFD